MQTSFSIHGFAALNDGCYGISAKAHLGPLFRICDVIKQNQSEVGNIGLKKESNKAENGFCVLLFLASFNCSYLWNQLTSFNGVFCKM